tara:strand:- start:272 stop:628 length:357 start_codon:yes stop_codon:yes gene_type:complete
MTATTTTETEKRNQRMNLTKGVLMESKGITALEFQFISDLSCSDFAFEYGREDGIGGYVNSGEGFDMIRVRGVMSTLMQKGYVRVDDMGIDGAWAVVTDSDISDAIYYMWYPDVTEVA